MRSLNRMKSTDSFATTRQDISSDYARLRNENRVGTINSDPVMNRELQRANRAIQLRSQAEAQAAAERQKNPASRPFFQSLRFPFLPKPRNDVDLEKVKYRSSRVLKDVRKTITSVASAREEFPEVCAYTFGEIHVTDFDTAGPRFTVRMDFERIPSGTPASKECIYERSRLLRYLSLRVVGIAGTFSVFHRPDKASSTTDALSKTERDNNDKLKSSLGASLGFKGITNEILELLNRTIIANRDFQYAGDSLNQIIHTAKQTVTIFDVMMHLHNTEEAAGRAQRAETDKLISSWLNALNSFVDSAERKEGRRAGERSGSRLFQPNKEKEKYDYALLKRDLFRDLNLKVLYKGPPESLGISCKHRASGSFGTTDKCILKKPQYFPGVSWPVSELAVKTIRIPAAKGMPSTKQEMVWRHCKRIVREVRVWCEMNDEHIVPIFGVWEDKEEGMFFCTVAPWISDGQLDHYLMERRPEKMEALLLMRDIGSGLDYMHNLGHGIVHGDLKPDNILVRNGRAFLTDFGLSHIIDDVEGFTSEVHGNAMWLAPEAITAQLQKTFEIRTFKPTFSQDMYSFGSLFLFVVYGEVPFEKHGDSPQRVLTGRKDFLSDIPARHSTKLDMDHYQLMLECWRLDPMLRVTAKIALRHLQKLIDLQKCREDENSGAVEFAPQITEALQAGGSTGGYLRYGSNSRLPCDIPLKSATSVSESTELAMGLIAFSR